MTPEQLEILEDSLYLIETQDHPFRAVYSDYRDPPRPIIQLDGDFTVDELRQIVAACDAAMGTPQVVEANVLSIDDAEALFWSQSVEEL